eukprot:1143785-Pelagomonas_calceolata.AAC.3
MPLLVLFLYSVQHTVQCTTHKSRSTATEGVLKQENRGSGKQSMSSDSLSSRQGKALTSALPLEPCCQ